MFVLFELEKLLDAPRKSLFRAPLNRKYEYAETKEEFQVRKKAAAAARKKSGRAKKKRVEANCNAERPSCRLCLTALRNIASE